MPVLIMIKKLTVGMLFWVIATFSAFSQSDVKPVQAENVSGFLEVMSYLGGKLGQELGSRLNLSEEENKKSEKVEVPTLVTVQWGPFKIERTENRPKKSK